MLTDVTQVLAELHSLATPEGVAGMARFGIGGKKLLGISAGPLRALAKRIGRNQAVAEQLWSSGIFEARILAAWVADPGNVTRRQANSWANDFECWADCDGLCVHLFRKTAFAHELAVRWSRRRREMVKRAGFTMMATLAVHDQKASNEVFLAYLDQIRQASTDDRHPVKTGVNWALRQIGKRNRTLNRAAIGMAKLIQRQDSRAARWIACDALRELIRWKPK